MKTNEQRMAVFKNSYLRLLLKLSGSQLLGPEMEETPESTWVIPGDVSADYLKDTVHFINQAEFSPPTFEEGVLAENQLKRKTVPRKKAAFDDDEDDGIDDELLFPVGGPTERKVIDETRKPKKTKRRRRKSNASEPPSDSELEEKARKRREREREKARKIKSHLYVKEGDDEFDSDEDREFFARERAIAARAQVAAEGAVGEGAAQPAKAPKKRKSDVISDDSDNDDDDDDDLSLTKRAMSSQDTNPASDTEDTPVDGSDSESRKKRRLSAEDVDDEDASGAEEDVEMGGTAAKTPQVTATAADGEDEAPVLARRPRVRGGFVVDSDDDE